MANTIFEVRALAWLVTVQKYDVVADCVRQRNARELRFFSSRETVDAWLSVNRIYKSPAPDNWMGGGPDWFDIDPARIHLVEEWMRQDGDIQIVVAVYQVLMDDMMKSHILSR